jgi:hypothetical protein
MPRLPDTAELTLQAAAYRQALKGLCRRVKRLAQARGCSEEQASKIVFGDRQRLSDIEAGGVMKPETLQAVALKLEGYEARPRIRAKKREVEAA